MARPAWTAQCTNRKLVGELLPVRRRESHKGDYGRVLLLCGSEGLTGAARLAAKAALRTGSGLVYLGVPEKIYPVIAAGAGSEIVFPLPCDGAGRLCVASLPVITERLPEMDAVLLGPGLGRSEELTRLVQAVLSVCRAPLVLDADGINAVAPHIDVLRGCACPVILTPHDGEFLRMGGDPKAADRTQEAMRLANRTHAVLLLKGSRTAESVRAGLAAVLRAGALVPVLATRDFMITPQFLKQRYKIPPERIEFPIVEERAALSAPEAVRDGKQGAVMARSSFASFSGSVVAARGLRGTAILSICVAIAGSILGVGLMFVLTFLGASLSASCWNLFLYTALWLLPGLLAGLLAGRA